MNLGKREREGERELKDVNGAERKRVKKGREWRKEKRWHDTIHTSSHSGTGHALCTSYCGQKNVATQQTSENYKDKLSEKRKKYKSCQWKHGDLDVIRGVDKNAMCERKGRGGRKEDMEIEGLRSGWWLWGGWTPLFILFENLMLLPWLYKSIMR